MEPRACIESLAWGGRSWQLVREDRLHPQVPGPKYRRLEAWLEHARAQGAVRLLTAGGPASNHLHGLAVLAREAGMPVEAIVRGEGVLTPLLAEAEQLGMKLTCISRARFDAEGWGTEHPGTSLAPDACFVPMGGGGEPGLAAMTRLGADLHTAELDYLCLTAGTGITLRGLVAGIGDTTRFVVAAPFREPAFLLEGFSEAERERILLLGSVGGRRFGRVDPAATAEALDFVRKTGIWTDNLYMPQLLFHLKLLLAQGYLPPDRRVGILHCGGAVYNRINADLAE